MARQWRDTNQQKYKKKELNTKMRTKTIVRHGLGTVLAVMIKRVKKSKSVAEKCLAYGLVFLMMAASAGNLTLTLAACAVTAAAAKHLNNVEQKNKNNGW